MSDVVIDNSAGRVFIECSEYYCLYLCIFFSLNASMMRKIYTACGLTEIVVYDAGSINLICAEELSLFIADLYLYNVNASIECLGYKSLYIFYLFPIYFLYAQRNIYTKTVQVV